MEHQQSEYEKKQQSLINRIDDVHKAQENLIISIEKIQKKSGFSNFEKSFFQLDRSESEEYFAFLNYEISSENCRAMTFLR